VTQQTAHPGTSVAPPAKLRQAVLMSAGKFAAPAPVPSAWQNPPLALAPANRQAGKPARNQQPKPAPAALVDDATPEPADQPGEQPKPKRRRKQKEQADDARPSGAGGPAEPAAAASAGVAAVPAREQLEIGPWAGVVDCCSPLGFSRFAEEMRLAPSCR
jgi:hypothetical protein